MEAPVVTRTPADGGGPTAKNGSPSPNGERSRAVDAAILQIEKQFGRGSIMRLGDREAQNVEAISTGSVALDLALGVGGIPRGRITEVYGPESSGKTTLCYHVAASAQRNGGIVAFIDAEHALDPGYAKNVGVNVDELLVSQPDTGEQALEIAETLIRSGGVDVVIVDSVAALVPRAEIEGDMGDSFVGLQARLMSQALRKLTGAINRSQTALIFTNQLREKIGVMFGNPETTPGGRALKFYASVRMDIRRIETLKTGTDAIGSRTRVKVVKNKVASPFRIAEFDIMYNEGISREGGLLDVGIAAGVLSKTGAWFNYGETRLGQGRENAREFLKQNPEIAQRIDDEIRGKVASIEVGPEGISEAE
jgi:recombination protein RecA